MVVQHGRRPIDPVRAREVAHRLGRQSPFCVRLPPAARPLEELAVIVVRVRRPRTHATAALDLRRLISSPSNTPAASPIAPATTPAQVAPFLAAIFNIGLS